MWEQAPPCTLGCLIDFIRMCSFFTKLVLRAQERAAFKGTAAVVGQDAYLYFYRFAMYGEIRRECRMFVHADKALIEYNDVAPTEGKNLAFAGPVEANTVYDGIDLLRRIACTCGKPGWNLSLVPDPVQLRCFANDPRDGWRYALSISGVNGTSPFWRIEDSISRFVEDIMG